MPVMIALALLGAVRVVAGVAFSFWPAALIVAGISLIAFALLVDRPADAGRSRT